VAPGDVAVGAYEDRPRFVDFADAVPVAVGVDGAGLADDDHVQIGQVELAGRDLPGTPA
jgi:hypothetical protein